MGDPLHKKSPPPRVDEEIVTDAFRRQVNEALRLNAAKNDLGEKRKGEAGYLICNRPELAEAVGTDKTMINKIIGPVRATTKVKLVDRSAFVGAIRVALDLPAVAQISVPQARAEVLRLLADLPDKEFQVFEQALRKPRQR
jgi:hypothetical protein